MWKKLLPALSCVLFYWVQNGAAQPIFVPGKVIDLQGDTLTGYIAEYGGKQNYEVCIFRKAMSSTPKDYGPTQVKSYWLEDRRYFKSIPVTGVDGQSADLFFEILLEGKLHTVLKNNGLYYSLDSTGNIRPIPLVQQKNPAAILPPATYVNIKRAWLDYLQAFALQCPILKESFLYEKNIRPTEENLIDIVQAFHGCLNEPCTIYSGPSSSAVTLRIGPFVGSSYAQLTFQSGSTSPSNIHNGVAFRTIIPEAGFSLLFSSKRTLRHFALSIDPSLRYSNWETSSYKAATDAHNVAYYTEWKLRWLSLHFPVGLRYTLPYEHFQIGLQPGVWVESSFNQKKEAYRTIEFIDNKGNSIFANQGEVGLGENLNSVQYGARFQVTFSPKPTTEKRWEIRLGVSSSKGIFKTDYGQSAIEHLIRSRLYSGCANLFYYL